VKAEAAALAVGAEVRRSLAALAVMVAVVVAEVVAAHRTPISGSNSRQKTYNIDPATVRGFFLANFAIG
jgi:hypothetical protein